ncbi:MAG: MFS transporter, partial [Paenibacillaceae bacterium]
IVGAAGGFGGYLLSNNILGPLKQSTGTHVAGFITVASIILVITLVFYAVSVSWRKSWATENKGVNF